MEHVGRQVCACSLRSVEKSIGALTFSLKRSIVLVPALTLAWSTKCCFSSKLRVSRACDNYDGFCSPRYNGHGRLNIRYQVILHCFGLSCRPLTFCRFCRSLALTAETVSCVCIAFCCCCCCGDAISYNGSAVPSPWSVYLHWSDKSIYCLDLSDRSVRQVDLLPRLVRQIDLLLRLIRQVSLLFRLVRQVDLLLRLVRQVSLLLRLVR